MDWRLKENAFGLTLPHQDHTTPLGNNNPGRTDLPLQGGELRLGVSPPADLGLGLGQMPWQGTPGGLLPPDGELRWCWNLVDRPQLPPASRKLTCNHIHPHQRGSTPRDILQPTHATSESSKYVHQKRHPSRERQNGRWGRATKFPTIRSCSSSCVHCPCPHVNSLHSYHSDDSPRITPSATPTSSHHRKRSSSCSRLGTKPRIYQRNQQRSSDQNKNLSNH